MIFSKIQYSFAMVNLTRLNGKEVGQENVVKCYTCRQTGFEVVLDHLPAVLSTLR